MDSDSDNYSDTYSENLSEADVEDLEDSAAITEDEKEDEYETVFLVPECDRTTSNQMTRFEFAKIIGRRARMIEKTGIHYADNIEPSDNLNVRNIALIELKEKKCPLLIRRMIGEYAEDFDVNEMSFPNVNIDIWEYAKNIK